MKSNTFRFKEFDVIQNKCAMKVNTDGVLLAAWAQVNSAKTILDIGTGTGVLALMVAQKNPAAIIDAIDIDEEAFLQAKENFAISKWSERLKSYHCSLQHFAPDRKYDIIISNPPYFMDDLKADNLQKNIAKHSIALTYAELIRGIDALLDKNGSAFIVIPAFNFPLLMKEAEKHHLFVSNKTDVISIAGKAAYLSLIELSYKAAILKETTLTISNPDNSFTNEYIALTKHFYLKF
jgi:tRNA1Val (adenine37-N6)-methyltransferase